ncbi:ras-related protein Rab-26 isoform X1 [Brachyhypopomus gauderio]|uniref:ras-related protein Rab-26 isoform X1 n=1 Tax=Brachyhypopomus gauderio TaxID=698409 RepID=UPI0040414833
MSRKKAMKGKGPTVSPSNGKDKGKEEKCSTEAQIQSNGVVLHSRPSLSNSGEFYDISFKVMLVGDSGVGKTCLLVRFKDGAFLAGSFISTVGIDFRNKVLNIDGVKVKLQIWDTAGQERFRSVTHAYYRDAHALLLLYDVTNKASFDNIQAWLTEIHEFAQEGVVLILLGNKADATHDRVVKREEGEKLAKLSHIVKFRSIPRAGGSDRGAAEGRYFTRAALSGDEEFGVPFIETSAKSGLNVELAFTAVAKELKHREMKESCDPKFQLQEYVNKEMKGAGCCHS